MKNRCAWVPEDKEIYIKYHDQEWGVPDYDDQRLFEKIILDGFQAGLSWLTILKKRQNFYDAFDRFDAEKIVLYDEKKFSSLLLDSGIIRNRLKINAAIKNARGFLDIKNKSGSFSKFIWQFVGGKPKINKWKTISEIPVSTPESDAMSKELKKRGFQFVGTTICYAFMQAVGMVNDHTIDCFRYREVRD